MISISCSRYDMNLTESALKANDWCVHILKKIFSKFDLFYNLNRYSEGKKKRPIWFCSNFMSFSPIDFIFIGWIGYEVYFCWVLRNFDFKPANEIFSKKGKIPILKKTWFLGVWSRKLSLSKIGVMDMSYIMDSGQNGLYTTFPNIFSLISADPADLSHIEKNHFFEKIPYFWIENVL